MTIDPQALLAHDFGVRRQHYGERDGILYALGLGLGENPVDVGDLAFLYERGLRVLPTFAGTLGSPGMWIREPKFGVDFARVVHFAQHATFHRPLPPAAAIEATARVASLTDRGEGRGAVLVLERTIREADNEAPLASVRQTLLLRGDGGFGGTPALRDRTAPPDRAPDAEVTVAVSPRAALIYRLSGDLNPLHIDPAFAVEAGFERPILHGLASYGIAAVASARALGVEPDRVAVFGCRFAGIVLPGDRLCLSIWEQPGGARFAAHVDDRLVLADGELVVAPVVGSSPA